MDITNPDNLPGGKGYGSGGKYGLGKYWGISGGVGVGEVGDLHLEVTNTTLSNKSNIPGALKREYDKVIGTLIRQSTPPGVVW